MSASKHKNQLEGWMAAAIVVIVLLVAAGLLYALVLA